MPHDTLATLIKVRRLACDEALRVVITAVGHEDRAMRAANEIERAIAQETEAAADPASPDEVVEAFGKWLPTARRQLFATQHLLQTRQAETSRARAELTACKSALESVETLQKQRQTTLEEQRAKKQQRELEDRPHYREDIAACLRDDI